jgi:ribonuclease P protein component
VDFRASGFLRLSPAVSTLGSGPSRLLYTCPSAVSAAGQTTTFPQRGGFSESREANLSAERASAQAPARVPGADEDARGASHPQAAPGARPEAPVGLRAEPVVTRRHRLSRSRDFDAVYRKGRSFSTRYLVVYAFPREDDEEGPRLGLAVSRKVGGAVQRNRLKRRLRTIFDDVAGELRPDCDYVLSAREGLAEAAEANDARWLEERVHEALRLAEGAAA